MEEGYRCAHKGKDEYVAEDVRWRKCVGCLDEAALAACSGTDTVYATIAHTT